MSSITESATFKLWNFLMVYVIGTRYWILEAVSRMLKLYKRLSYHELPRRDGQVAIVTGGSKGIGLETVYGLLDFGMHVIVASSSICEEGSPLEQEIKSRYPDAKVQFWKLDLSSLKDVALFSERFKATGLPLHILICNAGIMFTPYKVTEDGFESQLQVNYLSHCLLTKLLLPTLIKSATKNQYSRIVNVSSSAHCGGWINFDDLNSTKIYSKEFCYMQSKVAQVMFSYALQRFLKDNFVTVSSLHPGIVSTDLYKHVFFCTKAVTNIAYMPPKEGAETILFAALSPQLEGVKGAYLERCKVLPSIAYSLKKDEQTKLWDKTWELLQPWISEESTS